MNGIEATPRIRQQHPDIPVLVLTTYDTDKWVFDALRVGAIGDLLKDTPREQLLVAVRGSVDGKSFVDPMVAGKLINHVVSVTDMPPSPTVTNRLSEREIEVLKLLAQGQNNHEIARSLFLSEGTVRNYVSKIFAKLEVTSRTQAAVFAWRHGLVDR
ncbi:MAG: LuxR C-terminal-related transcriptional regulator [Ardenticatenaceae bacterium]